MEDYVVAKRSVMAVVLPVIGLALIALSIVFLVFYNQFYIIPQLVYGMFVTIYGFYILSITPKIIAEIKDGKLILHYRRNQSIELEPEDIGFVSEYRSRRQTIATLVVETTKGEVKLHFVADAQSVRRHIEIYKSSKTNNKTENNIL